MVSPPCLSDNDEQPEDPPVATVVALQNLGSMPARGGLQALQSGPAVDLVSSPIHCFGGDIPNIESVVHTNQWLYSTSPRNGLDSWVWKLEGRMIRFSNPAFAILTHQKRLAAQSAVAVHWAPQQRDPVVADTIVRKARWRSMVKSTVSELSEKEVSNASRGCDHAVC
jgi:hypothetical protein